METLARLEDALKGTEQEEGNFLEHPGVVYFIHERGDGVSIVSRQPSQLFSRNLLVSEYLVADHATLHYRQEMDKVEAAQE